MEEKVKEKILDALEEIEPLHREIVENYHPEDHYILPIGATANLKEIAKAYGLELTEKNARKIAAGAFSFIHQFEEELAEQTGVNQ
ncbi:hypothetical protein OB919_16110 [Halobacteria archaeon AArc-curdl1]|uniref:Uncharacterized protein n=1 Tax=Natronosalvus hydrolyticus TaxID=2979988 RepID=A0AAP3E820_9EURY|nr:hypothetical protein [Halobacteria archaeon AArc-curdl1]